MRRIEKIFSLAIAFTLFIFPCGKAIALDSRDVLYIQQLHYLLNIESNPFIRLSPALQISMGRLYCDYRISGSTVGESANRLINYSRLISRHYDLDYQTLSSFLNWANWLGVVHYCPEYLPDFEYQEKIPLPSQVPESLV